MSSQPASKNSSRRMIGQGLVAARVRALDERSGVKRPTKPIADIGPIPARLDPKTFHFLTDSTVYSSADVPSSQINSHSIARTPRVENRHSHAGSPAIQSSSKAPTNAQDLSYFEAEHATSLESNRLQDLILPIVAPGVTSQDYSAAPKRNDMAGLSLPVKKPPIVKPGSTKKNSSTPVSKKSSNAVPKATSSPVIGQPCQIDVQNSNSVEASSKFNRIELMQGLGHTIEDGTNMQTNTGHDREGAVSCNQTRKTVACGKDADASQTDDTTQQLYFQQLLAETSHSRCGESVNEVALPSIHEDIAPRKVKPVSHLNDNNQGLYGFCPPSAFSNKGLEIFIRERAFQPARIYTATIPRPSDEASKAASRKYQQGGSRSQRSAEPGRPFWRWWKLVLDEREGDPLPESEPQVRTSSTSTAQQNSGKHKDVQVEKKSAQQSSGTADNSHSSSSAQSDQTGDYFDPLSDLPSLEHSKGLISSVELNEVTAQSPAHLSASGIGTLKLQDIFGNGVLVDDEEIPLDQLESLGLINTRQVAPTRRRRSQCQQFVSSNLEPRQSIDTSVTIPKQAILPILQNDGADNCLEQSCANIQNEKLTTGKCADSDRAQHIKVKQSKADGTDASVKRSNTDGSERYASGGKSEKISICIEDRNCKILRVDIYPGRARAVIDQV